MTTSPKNGLKQPILGAFLHALVVLVPFVFAFSDFVPLQSYTHWAFRTYWILVFVVPFSCLVHVVWRGWTWRQRLAVMGLAFLITGGIVFGLQVAWTGVA